MEKNKNTTNSLKAIQSKNEVKLTLSSIAEKLKGKELFPDKVEKAKQFFKHLATT